MHRLDGTFALGICYNGSFPMMKFISVKDHGFSLQKLLLYYSPALKKRGYTGFAMSFCDSVTAKSKCILLNNFYVYGPTSVKLILHLVSKVSKV